MTIVAGVFLLLDLVPHLMEEFGGTPVQLSFLPFDPAWVTIAISGIPLLYLAVWRIIHNPGISKNIICPFNLYCHVCRYCNRGFVCCGRSRVYHGDWRAFRGSYYKPCEKGSQNLISLTPTKGRRLKDGKEEMIPAEKYGKEIFCVFSPVKRSRLTE